MKPATFPTFHPNTAGSLWMVASMIAFSFEDVFLKQATSDMPVGLVMLAFGGVGMVLFALLCAGRGQPLVPRELAHPSIALRFVFELFGRLFFTLSLALTSLSSTVAILQATPLVVVAGAAIVFGERVSLLRWTPIGVGLCGVLLILRPSTSEFSPLSILAVLSMLGLAFRDLATRAAPKTIPNVVLGFYSFASVMAAGAIYSLWEGVLQNVPGWEILPTVTAASFAGVLGYIALTEAMRTGDVSVVTSFRYTRLMCGAAFGIALFGETVDGFDVFGSLLIIGSGLLVLLFTRPAQSQVKKGGPARKLEP